MAVDHVKMYLTWLMCVNFQNEFLNVMWRSRMWTLTFSHRKGGSPLLLGSVQVESWTKFSIGGGSADEGRSSYQREYTAGQCGRCGPFLNHDVILTILFQRVWGCHCLLMMEPFGKEVENYSTLFREWRELPKLKNGKWNGHLSFCLKNQRWRSSQERVLEISIKKIYGNVLERAEMEESQ